MEEVSAVSPVHDALQDGGERCDADTGPNQDSVLGGKDLPRGSPIWTIYVTLTQHKDYSVNNTWWQWT